MAERTLKAAIGIEGLDAVLSGGLTRSRVFLLEGNPGTGKTTIATQFLLEGASRGGQCLYITLSETEEELRESITSHRWEQQLRIALVAGRLGAWTLDVMT